MTQPPSQARIYFDSLIKQSKEEIIGYLKNRVNSEPPTTENEWLDFKGWSNVSDDKVKEIWSQALSGFANTQGGVLVWGIECRKNHDTGVDCVTGLSPVANPHALKSRLLELHHQATEPPILGVEVEAYEDMANTSHGFVLCYVPESPFKPHRAEMAKKQYYIRAGEDFVIPSVSILRSLFYPRSHAHLVPELLFKRLSGKDGTWQIVFEVRFHNSGTASAYDAFVVLETDPYPTIPLSKVEHWTISSTPQKKRALFCERPLHPGTVTTMFILQTQPAVFDDFRHGVKFRFLIHAQNFEPLGSSIEFTLNELFTPTEGSKHGTSVPIGWPST